MQRLNAEREAALETARLASQQRVREAQAALEAQSADARKQIEASASQLAAQVMATVLPARSAEGAQ